MPGCTAVGCTNSTKKGSLMKKFPKDEKKERNGFLKWDGINGNLLIILVYVRCV